MLRNYLLTAWRNLKKNRIFTIINIAGLSIGITVCFIIMLYVHDEWSYDRFNKDADRIYRVIFNASINGGKIKESVSMAPVAGTMKKDFPEVQEAVRLNSMGNLKVFYKNDSFRDNGFALVDPGFFKLFSFPFSKGSPETALTEPNTVVITESMARKLFGTEDAIGKSIAINNLQTIDKITGVLHDLPQNSHIHFDMFGSTVGWPPALSDSWMYGGFHTYLLLKPGADPKALQARFPAMVEKYMGPQIQQSMGLSLEQFRTKGNELGFSLQPLTDVHLHADTSTELEPGGNASYIYIFGLIAIFMLLIACFNFINLSTAAAVKRAREVGVRKVVGSGRFDLIIQFLFESSLLVAIAMALSFAMIKWSLPLFNDISGKNLSFRISPQPLAGFLGLGILVSLLAGSYPAFVLSSFRAVSVLKGKFSQVTGKFTLRSILVVLQFFISVSLIIATIVVYQQMQYIRNKKLGYDKDHLMTIPNSYTLGKNEKVFKEEIIRLPGVLQATTSYYKPAGPSGNNNSLIYPLGNDNQIMKALEYNVDENYIPCLSLSMASGRNFSKDMQTDSTGMIINETAARAFGWNVQSAIGKTIVQQNSNRGANIPYHIIGVVRDFHFRSLHETISPLLMDLYPESGLILKIKTAELPALIASMQKTWEAFNTGEPFSYEFMNDLYNKTYATEQKTGTILDIFSSLTILVASLGLFGLITFTVEQRTREIGIRKVLGARVSELTRLVSKDLLLLVLISCILAFPVAWWGMNKWLESFAYRTSLHWWVFPLAGLMALILALVTISIQAIRAAIANPVKSLRTE